MVPHYRQLVENFGGRFMHHDGGVEVSRNQLPKMLGCADIERVRIINAHGKLRDKLASMALGMGDEVEIISNQGHGAILIMKQDNRFVLGGGMAHKIEVVIVSNR